MTNPETEEEAIIANLYDKLARLCVRYRNDRVLLPAIEGLGTVILRVAENGTPGRVDPITLGQQVRALVRRAGGDADNV
jgi:hypothetical protein